MAGVDSAGLGEVIHNLIPSFIESRSGNGTLDYIVDRAEVIQVFSPFYLGPVLVLMLV
jgi:actin-related protein 5